jgi:Mg-chelatase subunit ChlD
MEYRDKEDINLNEVIIPFTSDLQTVHQGVNRVVPLGGGDEPEALLDALVAAKNKLLWSPKAKRIVLVVTDAGLHPQTVDGLDEAAVLAQYQTADTEIAIYPILAKKEE